MGRRSYLESLKGLEASRSEEYVVEQEVRGWYRTDLLAMQEDLAEQGIPSIYRPRLVRSDTLEVDGDMLDVVAKPGYARIRFREHPREVARTRMVWHDAEEELEFSELDEEIYKAVWQRYH